MAARNMLMYGLDPGREGGGAKNFFDLCGELWLENNTHTFYPRCGDRAKRAEKDNL
jgi:hypothetical protein